MKPIRTVLQPTDFSAPSEAALELACSLARVHGARLVIVHVAPYEVTAGGMMAVPMNPGYYQDALDGLQDRVVGPSPGFPVEIGLREGAPAEEILRAADDLGADLIVMGSHGRTGLGRLLMGSVAEAVMRRADCPVLLAKRLAGMAPTAGEGRAAPAAVGAAPVPCRVIVTEGRCGCGVRNAHVIHRDFPEYWAEGESAAEGAANLEARLEQAREGCPGGDWHYDDLTRAIEEVQAFRTGLSRAGEPAAVGPKVGVTR
jgi:nucleotide-binding universal stress UspA family protein